MKRDKIAFAIRNARANRAIFFNRKTERHGFTLADAISKVRYGESAK